MKLLELPARCERATDVATLRAAMIELIDCTLGIGDGVNADRASAAMQHNGR